MLTKSQMSLLGTHAPDFKLKDVVSGEMMSLSDFKGKKALLVMFICKHCPYVEHIEGELAKIGRDYQDKDISIVAISSNDASTHSDDNPENLKEQAERLGFTFPYLYDETQEVAKKYSAACTPDFFLFDKGPALVYRGQLDDSRPGSFKKITGSDLRGAIDTVLRDGKVDEDQKPSSGCNIKWKLGNEPDYYNSIQENQG